MMIPAQWTQTHWRQCRLTKSLGCGRTREGIDNLEADKALDNAVNGSTTS